MIIKKGLGVNAVASDTLRIGNLYGECGKTSEDERILGVRLTYVAGYPEYGFVADGFAGIQIELWRVWVGFGVCWTKGRHTRRADK